MIDEKIKALLGEELVEKVSTALTGKGKDGKDINLVVGNDGSFVPADKYELLKQEKQLADQTAESVRSQLEGLKADSETIEQMKADLTTAQQAVTKLQEDHTKEISKIKKGASVKLKVVDSAFDPEDVISLIDLDRVILSESGEIIGGLDEQLTEIKTKKPHWFKQAKTGGHEPQVGDPAPSVNPWKKETFNLTEQGKITRDDPAKAELLKKQAGY